MIQIAESFWRPEDPFSFTTPRLFVTNHGYASVKRYMTRDSDRYLYRPSQLLGYPRYGFTVWVLDGFPDTVDAADPYEWAVALRIRGIYSVHVIDPRGVVKPDPNAKIRHVLCPLNKILGIPY